MNFYTHLAREAIEKFLKEKKVIEPPSYLPENFFKEKKGVFVTLTLNGNLRGCMGTYLPTQKNLAKEIIVNAISSAFSDPRFPPLSLDELKKIKISVSILEKPERIYPSPAKTIEEAKKFLDPKIYGVIVRDYFMPQKAGLLLPGIEEIKSVDEQLKIAAMKGGIDLFFDSIEILRFKTQKYEE